MRGRLEITYLNRLRSGDCDGHDSRLILSALNQLIAVLDVCLGSLSS